MKRVLLALTGTIAGLVALLSFKVQTETQATILPSASGTGGATAAPGNVNGTSTAPSGGTTATPAPTSAAPAATVVTLDGAAVRTRYGTVQVEVQMKGGAIASVSFLQLTGRDRQSQEINAHAGPILLQETLTVQSAKVSTVSGATYTSDGYRQSLQSALDQAAK
ncbi:MAG: FMN-binding protein [Pseudonocardiales bacterium]|nr:FMN-binding protein [Jatrophihabitantaceae bacterium]MCW2604984.1 FMN-binding protein [Pseudonocardiales bacterium]